MKAIVQDAYGPPDHVLEFREIDIPAIGDDDVLVRVRAASIHADVWHAVTGQPYVLRLMGSGASRPKNPVPGSDLSGHVERVGRDVTRFAPGDEVFGTIGMMGGWSNGGTFAEYAAMPQSGLVAKPSCVTFEQAAAATFSGLIAVLNMGPADALGNRSVLINGAGGAVGTIALQYAKAAGARVIAVDCAEKLEMLRQLGADEVVDYRREDVTQRSERYDLILDVATTLALGDCRRVLTETGVYVPIGHMHYGKVGGRVFGTIPQMIGIIIRGRFDRNLRRGGFKLPPTQETLTVLQSLLANGKLTPIVARTFPLSEVKAAIATMLEERTVGRIVIAP